MTVNGLSLEEQKYPIGRFDRKAAMPAGGRTALIDSLAGAPDRLARAVAGLTAQQLDTPYREGGWTVRQLVHHVPDSHLNAYIRFKWGLTEDSPAIKAYHEDRWAELADARSGPIDISLELLRALHARWDALLRSMSDADFARTIKHQEWGELPLSKMLQQYEWHGRHHEAHVMNLRRRAGW